MAVLLKMPKSWSHIWGSDMFRLGSGIVSICRFYRAISGGASYDRSRVLIEQNLYQKEC